MTDAPILLWRLSFVGYLIGQLYRGKFHFSVYWLVSYIVALVIYGQITNAMIYIYIANQSINRKMKFATI
jgi:hypothetical protein